MTERLEQHKQQLADSRARLLEALERIGERGDEQIYSEGAQWTLRQLAIHLALADAGHNNMIDHYTQGKEFIPENYDIERYNKRSVDKSGDMTLEQAIAALHKSRAELLAWFDAQEDDGFLDKQGRHASLRILSISEIIAVMAAHELGHTKDIMAMLGPSNP
jgi:hypothetical protein